MFDIVKDDRETIEIILCEIEMEIENQSSIEEQETLFVQVFNLSVFVGDFPTAVRAMERWYSALLCPFTSSEPIVGTTGSSFEYMNVTGRLDQQLRALLLARSVYPKLGDNRKGQHLMFSLDDLKRRILLAESLIAFYSFSSDQDSGETSILSPDGRCVNVSALCRTLSALGLIIISAQLANRFKLDLFQSALCPFAELVIQCERDPAFLPPCRWERPEDESVDNLMPRIVPAMAFVRSDASGPIGTSGNQLRAMLSAMEYVVRKSRSKRVVIDLIEFIYFSKNSDKIPNFLVDILEAAGGWTDLLTIYMRKEDYRACVRLVETHVKFWRPDPTDPMTGTMLLKVPLLVQLQRAMQLAVVGDDETGFLLQKLDAALEQLKSTLSEVSQRMVR